MIPTEAENFCIERTYDEDSRICRLTIMEAMAIYAPGVVARITPGGEQILAHAPR